MSVYTRGTRLLDFFFEVAAGNITGLASVNKFGRNTDTDALEDIWDGGGTWVAPTAARIHDIVSTLAADAAAGTGLRTVRVFGLDASFVLQQEDITLNGITNVPTVNTYTRIFRLQGLTFGSGQTNAGIVTATAQSDGTVTAQMSAGISQTMMAIYSVPTATTGFLTCYYGSLVSSGGNNDTGVFELLVRPAIDTADTGWLVKHVLGVTKPGQNPFTHFFLPPLNVQGPADIRIRATPSAANTDFSAGFDLVLDSR